jgi:hypothetical protein
VNKLWCLFLSRQNKESGEALTSAIYLNTLVRKKEGEWRCSKSETIAVAFLLPSGMRTLFVIATLLLAGCSPHFNWREFTSKDASYQVLFPDKPATASRAIDLDGIKTTMTMSAAEVDDILFAVGQAEVGDAAAASAGLAAMQTTRWAPATGSRCAWSRISRRAGAACTRWSSPDQPRPSSRNKPNNS